MPLYRIENSTNAALPLSVPGAAAPLPVPASGWVDLMLPVAPSNLPAGLTALPLNRESPTNLETLAAAIGNPSDAPWSGTGDGSLIAVMKAVALKN